MVKVYGQVLGLVVQCLALGLACSSVNAN